MSLTPLVIIGTLFATAFAALLAHLSLAVFNDGVRPFLLDFSRGEIDRKQMANIASSLSTGFIFGLGVPIALASGILNPWVLFLATDILGIFAPKKWLAPLFGAIWGAIVIFGLSVATQFAALLPINILQPMQHMVDPILLLFSFFPAVSTLMQFGKVRGGLTFLVSLLMMLVTMKWLPGSMPSTVGLVVGMALLIIFVVLEEVRSRKLAKDENVVEELTEEERLLEEETKAIFAANAARLRRNILYFIVMGILLGVLINTRMLAGGEATSFILTRGDVANAAQIDLYRAFAFIPLMVTTALASGAFQVVGFTLLYPIAYLLPHPLLAGIVGGLLFGIEILALSSLARALNGLRVVRDAAETIRSSMNVTLEVAVLFGSLLAGQTMAGGIGLALVGGLYLLNEVSGRPIVRMAAGPVAVLLGGILLNLLTFAQLFTPLR